MSREAFSCRMCGHCCLGEGGIILTDKDWARLIGHLNLSPQVFRTLHVDPKSDGAGKKPRLAVTGEGWCVFFRQGQGCTVHPARPDVCRAWPFFRGNLVDETSWEMIQEYCPGVNPEAGFPEFVRQGRDYLAREGLLHEEEGAPNALTGQSETSGRR